jgi:hypothetical protein
MTEKSKFDLWREQGTFLQDVQTGHGANPAFCPLTTGGLFPASAAARTWNRQFTAISFAVMLCHHFHFSVCLIGVVLMKRPTAIQPPGVSTHIPYLCFCGNRGLGTNTFCGFIASPISSIMILDTRHSDRTQCCCDVIFPLPPWRSHHFLFDIPVLCVGCYNPVTRWMTEQNSVCVTV